MTTGKRGRCRWTEPAVDLSAAILAASSLLACATPAMAATAAEAGGARPITQASQAAPAEDLYLEVVLNLALTRQIAHVVLKDGRLHADAGTLRSLGLRWPGEAGVSGLVPLDSLPGLRSEYDVANQRLLLMAPVALLGGPASAFGYAVPPTPRLDPATQAPGLLLNYDLYAQGDDDVHSLTGWNELRLFGLGHGVLRHSSLMQATGGRLSEERQRSTRLDTAWQLDIPDSMVSVTLGDAYSGGLSWSRTQRFGGVRVSRNFNLQPYRVTVPLASFAGETTVPSVVDLYINGIREASNTVAPGRFEVVSAPVLNGVGSAQMVITDITGQRRVVDFSLYNSARLLQQGLSDWSVEAGSLRRDHGLRSFSYASRPMASASLRHGLSNGLTLEAHGEATDGLNMAGVGALLLLGRTAGVVSAALAGSQQGALNGRQRSIGYEWQGAWLSLNLSTLRRNDAFRDVASLAGSTLPVRTDQAFLGLNTRAGQFGISHVRQDARNAPRASYAGLNWSRSFGQHGNLSIGMNRDLDGTGGTNAYLHWSMPLGERQHSWVSAEHQRLGDTATVGAMRTLPGDRDGWGWRVQASTGEEAGGQAEVSQLTRHGEWRAGTQHWRNQGQSSSIAYASASGGLLWMQGSLFPMRRVHDAFALVSTDGIADVPVMLENRFIGTTDERGLLLVTPLNAWENNELAIDPLVLPADVSVQQVRMAAVPSTGSGVLARFPMRAEVVVELALRGGDGEWVPAGSPVTIGSGERLATVGYDGRLYLQDPPAGAQLTVLLESGQCTLTLPGGFPKRGRIDLGELPCR